MRNVIVYVLCINANGDSDVVALAFTDKEYSEVAIADGDHLEDALKWAERSGYDKPMFAFDNYEYNFILKKLLAFSFVGEGLFGCGAQG